MRLLVIEDDPDLNRQLATALTDAGYVVDRAFDGEEGHYLGETEPYDAVILDIGLPKMDGISVLESWRRAGRAMPVLMLTGLDDEASINRAYQAGATDFFVKSSQWSLLEGRLRYLLRSSRTRLELERSKAKLARAQDLARMGSFEWWRAHAGSFAISAEGLRVFGRGPQDRLDFIGVMRMVPADDRHVFLRLLRDVIAHTSVLVTDLPLTLPDGRQRVVHIEAEPEFNEQGGVSGYTGILQDVTDRRMAEDRIRELANFDALTGLPNRVRFTERLAGALALLDEGHVALVGGVAFGMSPYLRISYAAATEQVEEAMRRMRQAARSR